MIPTIEEAIAKYPELAAIERAKTGRPCHGTVQNVLRGVRTVCAAAAIPLASPADAFTRRAFDKALGAFVAQGLSRISAWSYVCQTRALFARWCAPYWKDLGWDFPALEIPAFLARPPHYVRPSPELLAGVKSWYVRLEGVLWFAATMMLEFAMRNGDVLRLAPSNFAENGAGRFLSYTPHKTELTSGRRVYWPVHPEIWSRICSSGGVAALRPTRATFARLNTELRTLGFAGTKASYELRKICIDHVYQKYGAEMAVSISGDDVKTITRYYADPSRPNAGAVRIIDLL